MYVGCVRFRPIGKRRRRRARVNCVSGKSDFLIHVHDSASNRVWQVDGGAFLSLIPPSPRQRRQQPRHDELIAANGSSIASWGTCRRQLVLNGIPFNHEFIIADVKTPLLGADFLAANDLAPNHRDNVLLNVDNGFTIPGHVRRTRVTRIAQVDWENNRFLKLLDQFPVSTPTNRNTESNIS